VTQIRLSNQEVRKASRRREISTYDQVRETQSMKLRRVDYIRQRRAALEAAKVPLPFIEMEVEPIDF